MDSFEADKASMWVTWKCEGRVREFQPLWKAELRSEQNSAFWCPMVLAVADTSEGTGWMC